MAQKLDTSRYWNPISANKEKIETISTTTQQNISLIHPTLTIPNDKNTTFPQTTLQLTVNSFVVPKNSQMDYQLYRPIKKNTTIQQKKHAIKIFFRISQLAYHNPIAKPLYTTQNQLQEHTTISSTVISF